MPLSSRDKILNNLRIGYRGTNQYISPVFDYLKKPELDLPNSFKERITSLKGSFFNCKSIEEFQERLVELLNDKKESEIMCIEENIRNYLPSDLEISDSFSSDCNISITGCEYIVAQTGSVIVSAAQTGSRRAFAYPSTHIVIARKEQLIGELSDSIMKVSERYKTGLPSQITVITGPSRTADIEKTLVMGAHGPKELIVFYLNE